MNAAFMSYVEVASTPQYHPPGRFAEHRPVPSPSQSFGAGVVK